MVKSKELIICVISIVALILAITTNVFATNSTYDDIVKQLGNQNNNTNTDNDFPEIPSVSGSGNNTSNNTNNTTNTMPDTGVSYSSLVIIAIAGISAVYAYKKIKEYNV